jgi:TatD DNase family protein
MPAVVPAVTLKDVKALAELRGNYPGYKIGIGLHPWFIPKSLSIQALELDLNQLIVQTQPDFIGEIGLDYLRPNPQLQLIVLHCQLQLARQFNLPVVLHCVKAYNDVLKLLKQQHINSGIIHGFNANATVGKQFIDAGFLLGIGSLITKPSLINKHIQALPLDKLVLESDAPFMPALHKPKSSSLDSFLYAQIVAHKYNINLIEVINQSNTNVIKLFRK